MQVTNDEEIMNCISIIITKKRNLLPFQKDCRTASLLFFIDHYNFYTVYDFIIFITGGTDSTRLAQSVGNNIQKISQNGMV